MSYREPSWNGWQPNASQHSTQGHDSLALGSMLGRLEAGQERTIYVLELIHGRLEDLPDRLAQKIPAPSSPPPSEQLTLRDWMQLAIAGIVIGMALAGRIPLDRAVTVIGKPLGF